MNTELQNQAPRPEVMLMEFHMLISIEISGNLAFLFPAEGGGI